MVTSSRGKRKDGKEVKVEDENLYKGIIFIKGFPGDFNELNNLIKNQDQRESLMGMKEDGTNLEYYFDDNKVALSIGKKINDAYKESTIDIKFSKYEDTTRVYLDFS
ncbi:MAG: hypothetical protein ABH835_02695 [Patescibacteria group bacterium]